MFNSETMRRALEDRNLKVVAKLSGIAYMSLYRFASGQNTSMSYENMLKLNDYLKRGLSNGIENARIDAKINKLED